MDQDVLAEQNRVDAAGDGGALAVEPAEQAVGVGAEWTPAEAVGDAVESPVGPPVLEQFGRTVVSRFDATDRFAGGVERVQPVAVPGDTDPLDRDGVDRRGGQDVADHSDCGHPEVVVVLFVVARFGGATGSVRRGRREGGPGAVVDDRGHVRQAGVDAEHERAGHRSEPEPASA